MTTSTPDIQPAVQHTAQVAIVGAGPVGLMMANYLGQMGISVLVVEKLATLIDYPRAIGIDDESLRAMQAVGLVNDVLPHTTPWHAMRFLTPKGRCFADIQPMTDEFGWSRRNAFIQPQVDAVMYHGLQRFPQVRCLFSREVEAFSQNGDSVTLNLKGPDGERETVRADWLVACDGGASFIRRTLNIPFEGKTAPNQWIVIDIANDPLATPHVYLCCDPVRPYVSAALPHGVRRFEFMVMPGETEAQLSEPHNMRRLLSKVLPDPDRVELIRQRVYTHNARLAERFRINRVLLAGDAAHIMPVWQGQGYNSGMRDAFNLAWKLALVVNGKAGETLLDSYQQERRDHAKAMIDLSVTAGHVLAPPKRWQGATGWANFSRNIDPLVEAGYRVLLLDCPGWGKSDAIVNSGSRSDLNARILKSVVDQLGIDKVHLLGNSMGGHSAVAFTLSWPERVAKLVLMGGGTGGMSLFTPMPTEGIKLLNALYREPTIENLKKMMSIFVFDTRDLTEALFEARLNNMLSRRDHLDNFVKSLEANPKQFPDFGPRLGEISAPTLIVWGRNDRFVPMDAGLRLLAGIAGSELHIYRDCGHWAQWEHADSFNQLVLNFLARA